jgi:hypothetical protein
MVEPDRLQIKIYRTHMAYWKLKATDTHSVLQYIACTLHTGNLNYRHTHCITIYRMHIAYWKLKLQTHTHTIRNTYCFSTTTVVALRRCFLQYVLSSRPALVALIDFKVIPAT